ncbi:MAG: hypothetical protein HEP71_15255 [Roseivirga sp.]|nr:hypothetical protein [Roseivirga sp.]
MRREEDYMDQLFKDHFEDFAKSPGDEVWKGVVANGAMANGKKLSRAPYWKLGMLLVLGVIFTFGVLQGYQMLNPKVPFQELALQQSPDKALVKEASPESPSEVMSAPDNGFDIGSGFAEDDDKERSPEANEPELGMPGSTEYQKDNTETQSSEKKDVPKEELLGVSSENKSTDYPPENQVGDDGIYNAFSVNSFDLALDMRNLDHLKIDSEMPSWASLNDPLPVKVRRDMARSWMEKAQGDEKIKGGHWFVSGAFVADASLQSDRKFILGLDGLAFGAGKYLTPDSFIEISLRGAWDHGFNMRATYARLLLPGRLRPYAQGGVAWGENVNLRMGLGLLYIPENLKNWRFYFAANYESGINFGEQRGGETGVFEFGAQIRLSGTERVLSDNNWMNTVPLYELPTNWYAEASATFSFDAKTKVVDYSAYIGRYLKRRLFIRGGLRVDRDEIALPVQAQYHFLLRKQLRFGAYTGASINLNNARLGAELGLIAYYEVKPGWSLFVAPVILEGSSYTERLFETGIQLKLSKKK